MAGVAQRRNKTIRDMALSMGAIVIVVLAFVAINGGFSFSVGKAVGGTAPTADVMGGFSTADRLVDFPVVVPHGVPAGWHPNSFSTTPAPGTQQAPPTARGGWLTPAGNFITLVESSGAAPAVLAAEGLPANGSTGTVVSAGVTWTVGAGVRQEVAWTRNADGVTFLITGNATPADFATLAGAVAP